MVGVLVPVVGDAGSLGFWDWAVVVLVVGLLVASMVLQVRQRRHHDAPRPDAAYVERIDELRRSHERHRAA